MTYAYYPGCTLKTHAKGLELSALASLEKLGVKFRELEKWTCCGTVYSLASDDAMRQVAQVRILTRAESEGYTRLLTVCSMCYNTLKRTNMHVKSDAERLKTINAFMDDEPDYQGSVQVKHLLEVLRDEVTFEKIKSMVRRPLKGLKVSAYYGCLLLRPKTVSIDNSVNPHVMEDLVSALGAEPVDSPEKAKCCGTYLTVNREDIVSGFIYDILSAARKRGAELVVTSCPLCFFNLDRRQKEVASMHDGYEPIPVLYITQLLALALGIRDVYMFNLHYVNPTSLLKSKALL